MNRLRLQVITANWRRSFSKLTHLEVNKENGIAKLSLNNPPVNSLSLELLTEITRRIKETEKLKCTGLILTSQLKNIFSAGLDIKEMISPQPDRFKTFWKSLQEFWLTLYGTTLPTAAMINGHSPAGGCLIACACEYRTMLANFTIGPNESKVGLPPPKWFMSTLENIFPQRIAEMVFTQGRLFTSNEALKLGLVDHIAHTPEEAFNDCFEFFKTFQNVPREARSATKLQFRAEGLQNLRKDREQDLAYYTNLISSSPIQEHLQQYLQNIQKRKRS